MKILIDTNFIMIPVQFKIDIYEELAKMGYNEIITLEKCVKELEKLAKERGMKKSGLALEIMRKHGVKVVTYENKKNVDKSIVEYAKMHEICVGTLDLGLIETLKSHGIKIIRLRQKQKLIEEN